MWARLFDWFCYWIIGTGVFITSGLIMLPILMVRAWLKMGDR